MSTKEEKETLRILVQHVSRAFYEPKYTIIMDQLARYPVLKDDELAGRMGLQPKELNKVIAVLANDHLVRVYRQNELKEGAQRSVGKQYYYIDYEYFCNVVKWRVAKMWNKIDHKLRNEIDNKGYICPQCKQKYTPLEVDKVMDFARGAFICEICQAELVENEDAESVQGSKDRMMRFNHQMRFIREGLQRSESMKLPPMDVALWVKEHAAKELEQRQKENGGAGNGMDGGANGAGAGLKVAGADSNGKRDEGVGIMMVHEADGEDEDKRRKEREKEAELKRVQNALPAWHLKSTITGDLTALGVKESARAAANARDNPALGLGDESLRGLGVAGLPLKHGSSSSISMPSNYIPGLPKVEDNSAYANQEAELYDQYYATLAAASTSSSTPVSSLPTPSAFGMSEYGYENDEEEDKKPSIKYLESLSEYRKRSRSIDDVGTGGPKTPKLAKTDSNSSVAGLANGFGSNGFGSSLSMNGNSHLPSEFAAPEPAVAVPEPPESQPSTGEDPLVYVAGTPKPLSLVTEEDHDLMTPEEYTAYFEVLELHS
ncbi:transcription initiation factor TFIIE alpha subunit [Ephemerocybe angulata]|uniref:Transcription initiation factor TFIIE alpha subunit n=1 Tax=Ephemerocybe angulata TaxID=980116 RepID=A0A8H6MCG1_9AGAR|nr:transcription initiation factor TFIIE alpha subunit [Tulosesus angulatus]